MQGKGKAKVFLEKRVPRARGYNQNRQRRDFSNQLLRDNPPMVNLVSNELVYQILEKIKNEPYFRWPNKMGGDLTKRNQSLYCHYHQERVHKTKDCRTLRYHFG